MKGFFLLLFTMILRQSYAQDSLKGVLNPPSPCDGYRQGPVLVKRPIPYTYLREADVAWEKRVWREIDLREKQNQSLYYPVEVNPCRFSLFQVITKNILQGNLIAFADEEFLVPYQLAEIRNKLVRIDTLDEIHYTATGDEYAVKKPVADSTSIYRRVLKYRLKKDWFFDKQKSSLEVRIVGIGAYEWIGEKEAFRELYWVYFPACRAALAAHEVFNARNDSERRSYDELFWKRQFSSVVIKESNVFDRYINAYEKGIDALTESDRIKMDLFT